MSGGKRLDIGAALSAAGVHSVRRMRELVAFSDSGSLESWRPLACKAGGFGCKVMAFVVAIADCTDVFEVATALDRGWRLQGTREFTAAIASFSGNAAKP